MSKRNLQLLVILIILAGAAYLFKGPFHNWQETRNSPKNFLAGINFDEADKIEIVRTEKIVSLTKDGDKWKVDQGKFYAAADATKALADEFKKAQTAKLEIASTNKEKMGDFDLTKQYATEVKMYQGDKVLADFLIGKMTSDYSSSFISELNGDKAYSIPSQLAGVFSPYEWRDMGIFNFAKDKITKLRFQYPDRQFVLEKKGDKWLIDGGNAEAKTGRVEPVLDGLANLTAEAIPAQDFKGTDLDKHLIIVEAQGSEGNFALMIGKDNSHSQFFAKRGDSDNIFLISKISRDSFNKKAEDFK